VHRALPPTHILTLCRSMQKTFSHRTTSGLLSTPSKPTLPKELTTASMTSDGISIKLLSGPTTATLHTYLMLLANCSTSDVRLHSFLSLRMAKICHWCTHTLISWSRTLATRHLRLLISSRSMERIRLTSCSNGRTMVVIKTRMPCGTIFSTHSHKSHKVVVVAQPGLSQATAAVAWFIQARQQP
jgi:hypothetical protein